MAGKGTEKAQDGKKPAETTESAKPAQRENLERGKKEPETTQGKGDSPGTREENSGKGKKEPETAGGGRKDALAAAGWGKEKKELIDTLQRLQAEFENYKKRAEREAAHAIERGNAEAIMGFLPVADAIGSAMKNLNEGEKKVLEPIRNRFIRALKEFGVEEMHVLGKKFDHAMHDCIVQGCDPKKEDGIVLEEIQKGYTLNGKVLRHAKVKVNRTAGGGE